MKKVYYLSTCSTSKRIIKELGLRNLDFEFQDIKSDRITEEQLELMRKLSGSYENLFSRIARKYRELNLKNEVLSEEDYKRYILEDYTFLKRPVVIIGDSIFIGSGKPNLELLKQSLA